MAQQGVNMVRYLGDLWWALRYGPSPFYPQGLPKYHMCDTFLKGDQTLSHLMLTLPVQALLLRSIPQDAATRVANAHRSALQ